MNEFKDSNCFLLILFKYNKETCNKLHLISLNEYIGKLEN